MSAIANWIALGAVKDIGIASLEKVYEKLSGLNLTINDLFECGKEEIIRDFGFNEKLAGAVIAAKNLTGKTEADSLALNDAGIEIIPFFSGAYPKRLTETLAGERPPFLYVLGDVNILSSKCAAVLGDSSVSSKGEAITFSAAREIAAREIVTLSGMASGVDTIAHRAAIVSGGKTAAFIPCGMKYFRPPKILQDIMTKENTAIASPFYPDEQITKYNAFERNKIICALSKAVFIVEAPSEGGIFEAAKSAVKLNVPLYTAAYGEYPANALGNKKILEEMHGKAIMQRKGAELIEPNMDAFIADVKFN